MITAVRSQAAWSSANRTQTSSTGSVSKACAMTAINASDARPSSAHLRRHHHAHLCPPPGRIEILQSAQADRLLRRLRDHRQEQGARRRGPCRFENAAKSPRGFGARPRRADVAHRFGIAEERRSTAPRRSRGSTARAAARAQFPRRRRRRDSRRRSRRPIQCGQSFAHLFVGLQRAGGRDDDRCVHVDVDRRQLRDGRALDARLLRRKRRDLVDDRLVARARSRG